MDDNANYRDLLKQAVVELREHKAEIARLERERAEPIALVGIGCRFPASVSTPEALWRALCDGVDAVGEVPKERWDAALFFDRSPTAHGKTYCRWGAFLDEVDGFDPQFFGISPREAAEIDPQHRLLLEVAWEALEHAGVAADRLAGTRTGVFIGIGSDDYLQLGLNLRHIAAVSGHASLGSSRAVGVGRIAHVLGLAGPVVQLDTSCSSSLVAVHLACQSLRLRECDLALVGGVHLQLSPLGAVMRAKTGSLSREGRCKTFDATADGFVPGEGCGVVVLERASDAEARGRRVHAVIIGSAIGHDGRSSGLTAPNELAQEDVIRRALGDARVAPLEVGYVEAHGTGTALGDPIEVSALQAILGDGRPPERPLLIGSAKTNFGHLEASAGVLSLIKAALTVERGAIPAHLHLRTPNPLIEWSRAPVRVPTALTPWPDGYARRIAGVSSFGMSGTNAHVVIAEPPPRASRSTSTRPRHVLVVSAKGDDALALAIRRLIEVIDGAPLEHVCATMGVGRSHFSHRVAVCCSSTEDARDGLHAVLAGRSAPGRLRGVVAAGALPPRVALWFGGGPVDEAEDLLRTCPQFGATVDRWRAAVEGRPPFERFPDVLAHVVAQYAVAELWRSWGIEPVSVAGQGSGGTAALAVAGALSIEGAVGRLLHGDDLRPLASPRIDAVLEASDEDVWRRLRGTGAEAFIWIGRAPAAGLQPGELGIESNGWGSLLDGLAALYVRGAAIDWHGFERGYDRRSLALPSYPFQRKRYFSETAAAELRGAAAQDPPAPSAPRADGRREPLPAPAAPDIAEFLRAAAGELLDLAPAQIDARRPLLELGADSIVFVDLIRRIDEMYGVKLKVRQVFEELLTLEALARHIRTTVASSLRVDPVVPPPPARLARATSRPPALHPSTRSVARGDTAMERPADAAPRPLTEQQRRHIAALVERRAACSVRSRQHAERHAAVLCASRGAFAAHRPETRALQFPLVGTGEAGSRIVDLDGNHYVDLAMGFGVHLFGHAPPFLHAALTAQLGRGVSLGPECDLAAEVASLVTELTGHQRVTFCNSGTEAVMTAMRIARAATRRPLIAVFQNAYHGHFDATLVVPGPTRDGASVPMALGTPDSLVADTLVLPFDHERAFELIDANADALAAVLVEPVQNRQPDRHPAEFLRRLREVTRRHGILLAFDEVLLGFRIAAGGAARVFGVEPDLATYAKVLGAGLPIGVVAGSAAAMACVDGGLTGAAVETTYTAGTFARNPMSLAAARAVLLEIRRRGPGLYDELNRSADELADRLNQVFTAEDVPLRMVHFGSFFRIAAAGNLSFVYQPLELELFFHHLLDRGIYVWEGRTCFLSTAHTDQDVRLVEAAARAAVVELKEGGFWASERPRRTPAATTPGGVRYSLYFFGDYRAEFRTDKYRLLFEAARFADEHDFEAVWIPERHFHSFGGLSPNPSVLASALARDTHRIDIRAGSVVLPLHHPIRVAEEWALVDNLSNGRVGLSFAPGWHADDFVLAPSAFDQRRDIMTDAIDVVRRLWRGEEVTMPGVGGRDVDVQIFPLPSRPDIPIWITTLGNDDSYARAGALGAGVLTNLIGQTVEDLTRRIRIYRQAHAAAGHPASAARVTVLLHTFLGDDLAATRELAREPFCRYLESSVHLFQRTAPSTGFGQLTDDDRDTLTARAYQRYLDGRALIGTPEACVATVDALAAAGVDEIACFVDFGIDADSVLRGLPRLLDLKQRGNAVSPQTRPIGDDQRLLWLLAQMNREGSLAYHLRTTIHLDGALDLGRLQAALDHVVRRHDALRTTFDRDGDHQVVHPTMDVRIEVIDLSSMEPLAAEAWFTQDAEHAFDLGAGPLVRGAVLRLAPQRHLFVLTVHHIVCDGTSKWVLMNELAACYSGHMRALPAAVSMAELQARRQRRLDETARADEQYWLAELHGDGQGLPVLELPTDRPHPAVRSYRGSRVSQPWGEPAWQRLRRFAREHAATPFVVMLSAYSAFLHRITGQHDIIVGVPVAGHTGELRAVGFVSNLLPLRSAFAPDATFSSHLEAMRRRLPTALDHQDYPFPRLLDRLAVRRDGRTSPLVATTFNWERVVSPEFVGLSARLTPRPTAFARFALSLNVRELGDEIILDWEYSSDLFEEATIARLQRSFQCFVEAAFADPAREIDALPLLAGEQARAIAAQGCGEGAPEVTTILAQFGRWAARRAAEPAASDEASTLDYGALERRANGVAAHLSSRGVVPGSRVALLADRSVDAVVGILGIWKAGAAFLPVDPTSPPLRQAGCIDAVGAAALLVARPETAPAVSCPIIALGDCGESATAVADPAADDLAYIIYTSGSTGHPKGVAVEHRHLASYVAAVLGRMRLPDRAQFLAVSSLSVDLGFTAVFGALASGGCIHLVARETASDPDRLASYCEQHPIDCLKITPSHLEALLSASRPERLLPRHQLVMGGEPLSWTLVERLRALGGRCAIMNHYGPTETTVGVATFAITDAPVQAGGAVPIGRALPGCRLYVLDERQQPVPHGIWGELYVGGAQVSRGYLAAHGADSFRADPFAGEGGRMYRTGDRARLRPSGDFELMGRIDTQIKIRGFRIELGEVEAVLTGLAGVRDAAVAAARDHLVGYLVADDAVDVERIRQEVASRLPAHAVPWPLFKVDAIPRTPGGKIDRQHLPQLDMRKHVEPPRSALEEQISTLWQEALGGQQLGVNDNVFDCGGHSLLVARVASRLRRLVDVELPMSVFFQRPTVAGVAEWIETMRWARAGGASVLPSGSIRVEI